MRRDEAKIRNLTARPRAGRLRVGEGGVSMADPRVREAAMRRLLFLPVIASCAATSAFADEAVQRIQACIEAKAPEGLPTAGPLLERMKKEMEGGPQACIGLVQKACEATGAPTETCVARETRAWLAALTRDGLTGRRAAVWRKGVGAVRAQAVALCEASAAMSAWGGRTVGEKGRYGFGLNSACVRDAVAQQVLIVLVNGRGA